MQRISGAGVMAALLARRADLGKGRSCGKLAAKGIRMKLGAFSISLPVSDIPASVSFYQMLGFAPLGEVAEDASWAMMRNPDGHVIGLFKGMFDRPLLTFNPGWTQSAEALEQFEDVRALKIRITQAGGEVQQEQLAAETGPGSFVIVDPDGHPILIDQHV